MTFLAAVLRDSEAASLLPQRRRLLRSHEKLNNRIKGPSEKWGQIFVLFLSFPQQMAVRSCKDQPLCVQRRANGRLIISERVESAVQLQP